MEQRALRLGDLVEDYCPRERRVTDHVIVAMVEDSIRQTRCAACESEHEYKEARMPRKKTKQDDAPALAGGVLVKSAAANGHADDVAAPAQAIAAVPDQPSNSPEPAASADDVRNDDGGNSAPTAWFGHRP